MPHEGKYVYGIVSTTEAPNFGPIGIGGRGDEVVTVGTRGLAAVISNASLDRSVVSRENLLAHSGVIEKVAKDYTIAPMRFCTVAESTDEILAFLEDRERELKNLLQDLEGKVEIGITLFWKHMKEIYKELVKENRRIREIRAKAAGHGPGALIHAGELVEAALEEKKAVEGEEVLRPLKSVSADYREGDPKTEEMVAQAAFLVDGDWRREFDARVEQLGNEHGERIDVRYVGPMPPFSFVNLEMHWNGRRA